MWELKHALIFRKLHPSDMAMRIHNEAHTDFLHVKNLQWKGMRRGLLRAQQPLTEKYPRHCLCAFSSWKISSLPIRNNKKLVHLFKSPPPFWLCSEFDPLLHCIFYWCHPCGGWLRRGEKIGRAFNRRSGANNLALDKQRVHRDAPRDIFPRGARVQQRRHNPFACAPPPTCSTLCVINRERERKRDARALLFIQSKWHRPNHEPLCGRF